MGRKGRWIRAHAEVTVERSVATSSPNTRALEGSTLSDPECSGNSELLVGGGDATRAESLIRGQIYTV